MLNMALHALHHCTDLYASQPTPKARSRTLMQRQSMPAPSRGILKISLAAKLSASLLFLLSAFP